MGLPDEQAFRERIEVGVVVGATAFRGIGYAAALPVTGMLVAIFAMPLIADAQALWLRAAGGGMATLCDKVSGSTSSAAICRVRPNTAVGRQGAGLHRWPSQAASL